MGIDYKKKYLKYKNKYLEAKKIYGGASQKSKVNEFVKDLGLRRLPEDLQGQPTKEFVEDFLKDLKSDNLGMVEDKKSVYGLDPVSLLTLKEQLAEKIAAAKKQKHPPELHANINKLQNLLDNINAEEKARKGEGEGVRRRYESPLSPIHSQQQKRRMRRREREMVAMSFRG